MKQYDTSIRQGETTQQYYTRLAKVADQRLVRLEKLSQENYFSGIDQFAYAKAQKSLSVWGGKRFNTKMPDSVALRNEKIADMIHFIQSPTSTKQGITEVYQKRVDTLKSRYGIDLTWQELGKVMEAFRDESAAGSPTQIKALGIINNIKKEGIEKTLAKNRNVDDPIIMHVVESYLRNKEGRHTKTLRSLNIDMKGKEHSQILKELRDLGY